MMRGAIAVNVALLAAALVWLAVLILPANRIVRARNAFKFRRGRPEDFTWNPEAVPKDFRVERAAAPAVIVDAVKVAQAGAVADWPRALALVKMLIRHARNEGGIRADLATTYRQIVRGTGYCADYVRVYLAAAATAGLFCRQWAFSLDGFGGHGHTFVEIYDRDHARWAFIDVHNNVYAVKAGTRTPLDALALRSALLSAPDTVLFCAAVEGRLGYPHFDKLRDYYRQGAREWYLLWGNDVAAREHRGVARILSGISGRLAHRLGSGLAGMPPVVVIVTAENEPAVMRMEALRRKILWAFAMVAALSGALAIQLSLGAARDGRA